VTSTRPRGWSASAASCDGAPALERLDLGRDHAERCAEGRALEEDVDAEAGDRRERVREVDGAARLEDLLLLGREDAVDEIAHDLGRQLVGAVETLEAPAHANHRLRAGRQMEVRRLALRHPAQQVVDGKRGRIHSGFTYRRAVTGT
jgi:hypothetical protein